MKHNNYLSFLLMCWMCMLYGCVGQNATESQVSSYKNGLSFSNTPTLKLHTDKPLLLTVLLINNSSDSITEIAFNSKSANLSILNSECDTLLPGKSCKLDLQLNAAINDDGPLLEAIGKDSNGTMYQAKQLFNYTTSLDVEERIQTNTFDNAIISGQGKIYGIAIPFYKNNPNKQVDSSVTGLNNVLNQEIVCSNQDLSQCTLIITGLSDYSLNGSIKLSTNTEVLYTSPINILAASRGNLLSSNYNVIVSPADGNSYTNITLLNNGSESITEIKTSAINHSSIESQITVSGCSGSLPSGDSCVMQIKVNSLGFGNGSLAMAIAYKTILKSSTGNQNISDKLTLWLYYLNSSSQAAINIAYDGTGFINNSLNSNSTGVFTVTNTGSIDLNNLSFTKIINLNSSFMIDNTSSCISQSTLAPNQTCQFKVNFATTTPQNGYLTVQASASYKDSNNINRSITSNRLLPYYNANPKFAYFGRWTSSLDGFDMCTFDNNGSVNNCSRAESSNVIFGNSKQPLTIQPMLMFDNTTVNTYVVTNDNGKIYVCPTDRITGKFTSCSDFDDLPTIYGLHIYKHAMWDTISNSMKYYLYVGGQNYLGSDNYIGVCPITESGALISKCTLDSSIGADTSTIMFEESSIYEISYNNAKVCKLSPASGKTIASSCVSVDGNINTLISSAYINSMVVAVVKDSNNVKSRYAYLSNQGGKNGNTTSGSIIRCSVAKNTTTTNLDFKNCIVVDNVTNMIGLRGLEIISIGSRNYLYYTNNKNVSNGLLSREILQNGSLGNITTQPAKFSPTTSSYVSDQIYTLKLPEAFLQYNKYQYIQSGSGSFTATMTFSGSGNTGNTRVFFPSLPTGITVDKGISGKPSLDFAVESGLNVQTINVTVDRSKISSPKIYTIKAKTSNGVIVPDLVIDIK